MKASIPALCYTQDEPLLQRLMAWSRDTLEVRRIATREEAASLLEALDPTVLVLDLRTPGAEELMELVCQEAPETVIVAVGLPRSDPLLRAEARGVFAVEDAEVPGPRLRALLREADGYGRLRRENRILRQRLAMPAAAPSASPPPETGPAEFFRSLARILRHFDRWPALRESLVEHVAEATKVVRVGLFLAPHPGDPYRLHAGVRCLPETASLSLSADEPLVRWLRRRMHLVTRTTLPLIADSADHVMLQHTLDQLGAEVLLPLPGRRRLLGWLFLGHRATGLPFNAEDLDELSPLADYVGLAIEDALLYEELTVQKNLAETVLQTLPVGMVTVDGNGRICAINPAAHHLFSVSGDPLLGRPVSVLNSRLGDLLLRCLREEALPPPVEWTTVPEGRTVSATARRLNPTDGSAGALAIIQDLTAERELHRKQREAERATFWAELAAAISHEVRNPLVAISTFAQLLPERYQEPDFRQEFYQLVVREIGRLTRMVEQINLFANPPELKLDRLDIRTVLDEALTQARRIVPRDQVHVEGPSSQELPLICGDRSALVTCFTHLLVNALEAFEKTLEPRLHIQAQVVSDRSCVQICIRDNGCGIPDRLFETIFSPFATTKARGIGLGLPIARRIITDHGGQIVVERLQPGTLVTVSLPTVSGSGADSDRPEPRRLDAPQPTGQKE